MKQPETQENNPERPPALAAAHGSAHPGFKSWRDGRGNWVTMCKACEATLHGKTTYEQRVDFRGRHLNICAPNVADEPRGASNP